MSETLNHNSILKILIANKQQLVAFGVEEIGLFGSFVRNEQRKDSDIDLLVNIHPPKKTFQNFMRLNYYLEELLGRKVELITKQSLSPYIGPHILKTVQYASLAD